MCSFITEIFSFEDKPTISHYSNRPKELIFAAVYSPGSYSNPSVTIRNDRLSVFLSLLRWIWRISAIHSFLHISSNINVSREKICFEPTNYTYIPLMPFPETR